MRKPICQSLVLAILMIVADASPALGHIPVAGAARKYSADYQALSYKFSASAPAWLRTAANTALQTQWVANNNSRSPRFAYSSSGSGTVTYRTTSNCQSFAPDWIGCAEGSGTTSWTITVREDFVDYCENGNAANCYRANRLMLHEGEHITLTLSESAQSATVTNMGGCPPSGLCHKPNQGWDSSSWKECDQAAFQMKYGLQSLSGQYADCFDHIADHGTTGLATVQTVTSSSGTTCAGTTLTRSGRISTKSTSNYGLLSNLGVAGRLIRIDRKLSSSSTWTLNWSSFTTGTNQTANNWSRSFSENVPGTYNYRIRFAGEPGLSYSEKILTLTFTGPPCPLSLSR